MISAHRCGAGSQTALENTRVALDRALQMDIEYVEFDVQRCGDETFVLFHNDWILIQGSRVPLADLDFTEFAAHAEHYLRYDEVLAALAAAGKRAHIDFKFTSDDDAYRFPERTHEVVAAEQAFKYLDADQVILTTLEDRSVRVLRDWADARGIDVLVGLSLGRDLEGAPLGEKLRIRLSELFPHVRYRRSRANLVVVNHKLASATVARFARLRRLPMLVWTVDEDADLRRWLEPGAAWLVTTNHPDRAVAIRNRIRARLEP